MLIVGCYFCIVGYLLLVIFCWLLVAIVFCVCVSFFFLCVASYCCIVSYWLLVIFILRWNTVDMNMTYIVVVETAL